MVRSSRDDDGRQVLHVRSTGEALSESLQLTSGLRDLVVRHERLPSGRRASSPHAHSHVEEVVYVLRGEVTAWVDGRAIRIRPSDCLSFPAGTGRVHPLANETDEVVEYLVVSTVRAEDVVAYPEAPARSALP